MKNKNLRSPGLPSVAMGGGGSGSFGVFFAFWLWSQAYQIRILESLDHLRFEFVFDESFDLSQIQNLAL